MNLSISTLGLQSQYSQNSSIANVNIMNVYRPCFVQQTKDKFQKSIVDNHNPSFGGIRRKIITYANRLPLKLTKYDNIKIKQARQAMLDNAMELPPTSNTNTVERKKLRNDIVKNFFRLNPEAGKDKNFYLVIGLPGSGKSTLGNTISKQNKALHIDSDEIIFELPEYKVDQSKYYVVSDEIYNIVDTILQEAMQNGCNIVMDNVGHSKDSIIKLLDKVKVNGYKVHLRMVDLPSVKATKRALTRFEETNRFVDPLLYLLLQNKPLRNYKELISSIPDYFSSFALYSSDVPKGEPFRLISGSEDYKTSSAISSAEISRQASFLQVV